MKRLILLGSLFLISHSAHSQEVDYKLYDVYSKYSFNVYDILNESQSVGWIPKQSGPFKGSFELYDRFMISIVKSNYKALEQMRLEACHYCSILKSMVYIINKYNNTYKPVSLETWFEKCPYLYTSMNLDNLLTK